MKKFGLIILCVLLVSAFAVTAMAAQSAYMSVYASTGTVGRGDTVTVTVSTSGVENCTSGGFMFSYDQSVFEYVGGSSLSGVSGFTAGVSTAAGNVAGYFMNGNATVQGNIFQITLRVRDSAPFGTFIVSGVPNLTAEDGAVACSAGSVSVTVVCSHSYGAWTDAGNGQHSRTCSYCQNVQTESCAWNNGTVTKQPTCKESGTKEYTCSICNAVRTEVLPVTNEHNYQAWSKVDENTHRSTCVVCSKTATEDHAWNGGAVTKPATCKETGVKTYTCNDCGHTKTESIPKLNNHVWEFEYNEGWVNKNDTYHARTCKLCGHEETEKHSMKTTFDYERRGHWRECRTCEHRVDQGAHVGGADATETTPKTCTVCGYVMVPALGHTHTYEAKLTCDAEGHGYACTGCGQMKQFASHDYENDCDPDCSVCKYTRKVSHKFVDTWDTNEEKHWHTCSVCGVKEDEEAHIPGAEATAEVAQVCTVCSYELAPALETEATEATEVTEVTETTEVTEITQDTTAAIESEQPATEETSEHELAVEENDSGNSLWLVILGAVVVIGGIAAVVVWKKKK